MPRSAKSAQVNSFQFARGTKHQHLQCITIGFISAAILLTFFYSSVMNTSNFVPSLQYFSREDLIKKFVSTKANSNMIDVDEIVIKPKEDSAKQIAKAKEEYERNINNNKECYKLKKSIENVIFFDDIEKTPPKPDKSIFFIDTTCYDDPRVQMNSR